MKEYNNYLSYYGEIIQLKDDSFSKELVEQNENFLSAYDESPKVDKVKAVKEIIKEEILNKSTSD